MEIIDDVQILVRRDVLAALQADNPTLGDGELLWVSDTRDLIAGPGAFNDLWTAAQSIPNRAKASADAAAASAADAAKSALAASPAVLFQHLRGVKYVAYGHSFGQVQGSGVTANTWPASLYPIRVRDAIGADPAMFVNNTVSGAGIDVIVAKAQSTWNPGDYGVVTLLGNQNTVGYRHADPVAPGEFKTSIRTFINTFRQTTYGPTVVLVLDTTCTAVGYARYGASNPPNDADVSRFNGYLRDVAAEYPADGSVLVADAFTGWDPTTMTCQDGQHPNDRGSAHIAAAILATLMKASYREGQNIGIAPKPASIAVLTDSFNRTDSATSLGNAETGQAWAARTASVWGIAGSKAYPVTVDNENTYAVANSTASDVDLTAVLGSTPTTKSVGLVFRADADASNCYMLDIQPSGNITLYKRAAGAYSGIGGSSNPAPKAGDVWRIIAKGSTVTVYLNGAQTYQKALPDSFQQTATYCGMRSLDSANTIDSIKVMTV
jgi:hypothetical protein